jgi:RNA polymerase sigma-54 factor
VHLNVLRQIREARAPPSADFADTHRSNFWHARCANRSMNELSLRSDTRHCHTLTPRLQRAVRLLQLSSLDYVRELRETLARNPFLDTDDGNGDAVAEPAPFGSPWAPNPAERGSTPAMDERPASEPVAEHESAWDHDSWATSTSRRKVDSGDGPASPLEMMAAAPRLRDHLHGQANVLPLTERDRIVVQALIESLEDDGYLRVSLEDVAQASALSPLPTAAN